MDTVQFESIITNVLARTRRTLQSKAQEYARGDRFSNFKDMAVLLHTSPEQALIGLVDKHWVALHDYIRDIAKDEIAPWRQWDEKIGDIMAYMVLLQGLIHERLARPVETDNTLEAMLTPVDSVPPQIYGHFCDCEACHAKRKHERELNRSQGFVPKPLKQEPLSTIS